MGQTRAIAEPRRGFGASPASQAPLWLRPGMRQSAKGSLSPTLAGPDPAPGWPGSGPCYDRAKSRREGRSQQRGAKFCSPQQRTGSEGCRAQHTMLADKPPLLLIRCRVYIEPVHACVLCTHAYIHIYIYINYIHIYIHTYTHATPVPAAAASSPAEQLARRPARRQLS